MSEHLLVKIGEERFIDPTERSIPYQIKNIIGSFEIDDLANIPLEEYMAIFIEWLQERISFMVYNFNSMFSL